MTLDYFYGQSGELFSYFRIPKALFQDHRFRQISTDARTLYGILLDRMSLSVKNGWLDEQGRVYIIYTVREVQESLCCAEHKAVKLFRELEDIDLIERKRRGLGRPSLIYVKDFSSGLPKAQVQNCPNSHSGAVESAILEQSKPQANNLVIPRETYQRPFSMSRAQRIAAEFDERIANEPKVSFRDGRYFVFDGQHTIIARKILNGNQDVLVKCKVYYGMNEEEESLLFAQQTGVSAPLSAGARIRAEIFGNDPIAVAFYEANNAIGLQLDYDQERGLDRIGCIKTAFDAYKRIGEERYKESMTILKTAWDGEPDSFRTENVLAITYFVDLYHDQYCPQRLVTQLHRSDPLTIYREGRAIGVNLAGYKKYLFQLLCIYNGNSKKYSLPMKF